ncbi:hypothetical protein [Aliivibrio fischeri]|uniref:hypothetical protein n=1 Tax=Aliivibrio fischeri TaxID=668 RepID=UPI00080E09EE|nr:hypothetical protein [Aliivibrio fischeri]OCH38067.1 hypothetical protein A6E02_18080 [Aliivibrio fischeri]OED52760.1 hypothetical protein BEI47_19165 [Aliivibrio fischeri]
MIATITSTLEKEVKAFDFDLGFFVDFAIGIVYQERSGHLSLLKYDLTLSIGGACDEKSVKSPHKTK